MRNNTHSLLILAFFPLLFLAVFYFYPLTSIFYKSFFSDGGMSTGKISKLFSSSYYAGVLWFTLWQAVLSSLLSIILALPGAYIFSTYKFPFKKLLRTVATIPFVMPTVVAAAAIDSMIGPSGLVNTFLMKLSGGSTPYLKLDHSIWMILIAHVFFNYSVVLRIVESFWSHLGTDTAQAAMMLGASKWQVFRKITLPLIMPSILASGLLVFIFCFSSFGVILILGGPRFSTIEVEIYRQAVHIFNLPMAATLSLIQIIFMFAMMWIYTRLQERLTVSLDLKPEHHNLKQVKGIWNKTLVFLNISFIILLAAAPLLALLASSFKGINGLSFENYFALFQNKTQSIFFVPPFHAVLNSLGFAIITTIIALAMGLLASLFLIRAKGKMASIFDPVFMLPLSTSAVTLGFGFIISLDTPPLNLRSSVLLVPIAHSLVAFPFVIRALLPAMRTVPQSLKDAASMLGASPFQVWKNVELPVTLRAIIVGAVFAFTVSVGEFGATAFTAGPKTPTMPLAVYRFLGQPGAQNYGQAMAMSSIMMITVAMGFMFLEKIKAGKGDLF